MADLRITRENARFQQWEALLTNRSKRHRNRELLVQGVRPITRAVEEGWPVNSLGSYVASEIMFRAFDYLDAPVAKVSGKDVPMPYAANLEKLALPSVADVIEAVKAVTYR